MAHGVVTPAREQYDLDMASNSQAVADVQRGISAIRARTEANATASFTLDTSTDALLAPFLTMFQFERIKSPYSWMHVVLLLYAPLGAVLVVLRLLCAFAIAAVLPRFLTEQQLDACGIHGAFAILSGTRVTVHNAHLFRPQCDGGADILVANHISEFDAIALRSLTPCYLLGYDFYKKLLFFRLLGDKFGLVYVPYASRNQGGGDGRDRVRELIVEKLAKHDKPLAAFPEGGLTNGQVGLLQYHKFLFSLGKSVQPLVLHASDGPLPININDETSTFLANVLWYMFVPWHHYTIDVLPVSTAGSNEDPLEFAQRVMRATATSLQQHATPFLYRDKIAFTRYKTKQMHKKKK